MNGMDDFPPVEGEMPLEEKIKIAFIIIVALLIVGGFACGGIQLW
jgi:hypothetical protein